MTIVDFLLKVRKVYLHCTQNQYIYKGTDIHCLLTGNTTGNSLKESKIIAFILQPKRVNIKTPQILPEIQTL